MLQPRHPRPLTLMGVLLVEAGWMHKLTCARSLALFVKVLQKPKHHNVLRFSGDSELSSKRRLFMCGSLRWQRVVYL